MAESRDPVEAVRVELYAPVASFRDPMFPGVSRGLPVPPLSTLRGLLAAATGRRAEPVTLAVCAHADGRGVDAETYHPIARDGSNPAVGGRVAAGKGGMTIQDRPFLTGVHVTLWIPEPDAERIEAALRRPVWALRLGRSQDLAHIRSIVRVSLQPAHSAEIGFALAPPDGHHATQATVLRLADQISGDRLDTAFRDFLWCAEPPEGPQPVTGAYQDGGQAVWLHAASPLTTEDPELAQVLGKSRTYSKLGRPELLTEHSTAVRDAARTVAHRIGSPGVLGARPQFWDQVETAALLHDAGKIAEGFQRQLRPGGEPWGERHEVLSLAYVDLLTADLPAEDRKMISAGVAFHHLCLVSSRRRELRERYPPEAAWERKFGRDPYPPAGGPRVQVTAARHRAWLAWLADQLDVAVPAGDGRRLWQLARDAFARVHDDWRDPVPATDGLIAVLLQGAVTLADHSGSAHVPLQTHMPLRRRFITTMPRPYPHQQAAAETGGHLILCAPTGSGKTEAGLAWASRQFEDMPGEPRLLWVLPYRASIDAARDRFIKALDAPLGQSEPDIGVLHATAARTLLTRATADDCPPGRADARKASARVGAMRLFAQRIRVATPHQLLRAAIAGPRYSSVLLEQANATIVLDELHAYDPATFGRLCATMQLWTKLGSRVAVLSATLALPMIQLLNDTLDGQVTLLHAPPGTAPDRHCLVLDDQTIDSPASVQRITDWLQDGHSVLVIANTVATAQHLFEKLAPIARAARPDDQNAAILLHSRFKAEDRAKIEQRITARHPERQPGETGRRGGLVVATQVLEVSLCLDFDRGVSELAPIEAVAQRAGRVNRRGRHPDGAVEFRVHQPESHHPYQNGALQAALLALQQTSGQVISEQSIEAWLTTAYNTDWGRAWAAQARKHRQDFTAAFLTFPDPFHDRSDHADGLDEKFDTTDVLLHQDVQEYQRRSNPPDGDPLLAAGLLIPVRYAQIHGLAGSATFDKRLGLWVINLPYNHENGLNLTPGTVTPPVPDTVL